VANLLDAADRLARTEIPLLLSGESGTGKEVLARRIHAVSPRADGPFVAENCAAIPESLLESEFFGHVRGAFTGATCDRDGAFTCADGGTLFLDEIGDMPLALQGKLLRVLEDGLVRPVGASAARAVDVRVVCATNQDLPALVHERKFRGDLYFRLRGAVLQISPLRERREDIGELARYFLRGLNREHGTQKCLTDRAVTGLTARFWPGNARELRNEITLLYHLSHTVLGDSGLDVCAPDPRLVSGDGVVNAVVPMAEIERDAIRLALAEAGGDCSEAARRLGMSRSCIYTKIKKHGLPSRQRHARSAITKGRLERH